MATNSPPSSSDGRSRNFDRLSEPVRRWIWKHEWRELHDIQEKAIGAIFDSEGDVIITAPTAGGKTEAAFLPIISQVSEAPGRGFKALYISPLKALINDQFRRLDELCEMVGEPIYRWHGDVSAGIKARARRNPDGLVLITPESLEALLVRRGLEVPGLFAALQFVVIDELHAFIGDERGRQLQSLLARIEHAVGHSIRRVGLSATLGDMNLAAGFLRPGGADRVTVIRSGQGEGTSISLQVRGYERASQTRSTDQEGDTSEASDRDVLYMHRIAEHIFRTLRGHNGLVFGGSRTNVEIYADRLRAATEALGLPPEFFPHHANLSRSHREFVESRLREGELPTSAICTSTLELGIDIGSIKCVAQIGAPWSVASLRQRLGRSGRRGEAATIRLYVAESEIDTASHPADSLRCQLVQAIAMVRLLIKNWFEPPHAGQLHLSTLVQQTLALIAQHGGVDAAKAYDILCRRGAFDSVSPDVFTRLLRSMGSTEHKLLEQAPDGTLLLGENGERIVDHYDFYAVFQSPDEYQVIHDGRILGTLPILTVLLPGMTIIFSGRRWQILEVRDREKIIDVTPSHAGTPPPFASGGGDLDDGVVSEMRAVYEADDVPRYLEETARRLLEEGRATYRRYALRDRGVVEIDGDTFLFPWVGSRALETLLLALRGAGLDASMRGVIIEVTGAGEASVQEVLRRLANEPPPDAVVLAAKVETLLREKYDPFLTRELLAFGFAKDRIQAERVPVLARQLVDAA